MRSPLSRTRFARRLKDARVTARLSQAQASAELGVSKAIIGHWETGRVLPDALRLAQLCHLYGVPSDFILFGLAVVPVAMMDTIPQGACEPLDRARKTYQTLINSISRRGHDSGAVPLG